MIVIVDYGMGNINSISNIIAKSGHKSLVTSKASEIRLATKIILPGVGSFDNGMQKLKELGLIDVLTIKALEENIPILGICLGMQLMTKNSQEGKLEGLGWIDALTVRFDQDVTKIPHMGWNFIEQKKESVLFSEFYPDSRFYFMHSFFVKCNNIGDILTLTEYGKKFCSSFQKKNIYGVQFHPEKSHKFGIKLFHNFICSA